jgi:hypothetical protein
MGKDSGQPIPREALDRVQPFSPLMQYKQKLWKIGDWPKNFLK